MSDQTSSIRTACPKCNRPISLTQQWKQCACSTFLRLPASSVHQMEIGVLEGDQIVSQGFNSMEIPASKASPVSDRVLGIGMILIMVLFIAALVLLQTCVAGGSPTPSPAATPASFIPPLFTGI